MSPAPDVSAVLSCLLPLLASCASGLAAYYMYASFRPLSPVRGKNLLVRQLRYLACADIVYSVFEVIHGLLDLFAVAGIIHGMPLRAGNHICEGIYALTEFGNMASLLFECHLAFAFVASTSKSVRSLDFLSRHAPLMWALALILATASVVTSKPSWNAQDERQYACFHPDRMRVKMLTTLTTFILCLVAYIVSSCHVLTAGARVQKSVVVRGQTYVLLALVFMAPLTIYDASRNYVWEGWDLVVYMACKTLYNLNGSLNFAMYCLQCRQAKKLLSDSHGSSREGKGEHTFSVNFRAVDSYQDAAAAPLSFSESELFFQWFEWRHTNSTTSDDGQDHPSEKCGELGKP